MSWKKSLYIIALCPYPFIFSMMAYYFRGIIIENYEQYDSDKLLDNYEFYGPIVAISTLIFFFSFFIWSMIMIAHIIKFRQINHFLPSVIGCIGYGLGWTIMLSGIPNLIFD